MKIWEWLSDTVDSHGIYNEPGLSENFVKETSQPAGWPQHSVADTNKDVGGFKGVIAPIAGQPTDRVSYGWQIACWLEETYAQTKDNRKYEGRGSRHQAALRSLKSKGV